MYWFHMYKFTGILILLHHAFVEVVKKKITGKTGAHRTQSLLGRRGAISALLQFSSMGKNESISFHIVTCPALTCAIFNLFQAGLFSIGEYIWLTVWWICKITAYTATFIQNAFYIIQAVRRREIQIDWLHYSSSVQEYTILYCFMLFTHTQACYARLCTLHNQYDKVFLHRQKATPQLRIIVAPPTTMRPLLQSWTIQSHYLRVKIWISHLG